MSNSSTAPPPYSKFDENADVNAGGQFNSQALTVQVAADCHQNESEKTVKDVLVKIIPPDSPPNSKRPPVNICAVIDISGSMGSAASVGSEDSELSILDVVKHAMRTIIASLLPDDRLCIVSFSNDAKLELRMTLMTDQNKKEADRVVEDLNPTYSTNLWAGLAMALKEFQNVQDENERFGSIFLLTDGLPNMDPPRGHIPMLLEKKDQFAGNFPTINTFGFGYSLESQLLSEIAIIGNGQYSFIPDASFVGTVFIHAITAALSTCYRDLRVIVENVAENEHVVGFETNENEWSGRRGVITDIGSIMYGQSRDVIIPMRNSDIQGKVSITVQYTALHGAGQPIGTAIVKQDSEMITEILSQKLRLKVAETLQRIVKELVASENSKNQYSKTKSVNNVSNEALEKVKTEINQLIAEVESAQKWNGSSDDIRSPKGRMKQLLVDLQGQVREAFEAKSFIRWGQHYIPSLARTHLLQICNNFKDPGVQPYIGKFASGLRLELDDIFLALPAPKPSRQSYSSSSASSGGPLRMAKFHNANNPCFAGSSRILMQDGSMKRADEAKKGDTIVVNEENGEVAKIACVVVTEILDGLVSFAKLGELLITPYHPIIFDGKWVYPKDVPGAVIETRECQRIYSFVLDSVMSASKDDSLHTITIERVRCATFGHGLETTDVIKHDYFGTEAVINDLKKIYDGREWENGQVRLGGVRRGKDGMICGLVSVFRTERHCECT